MPDVNYSVDINLVIPNMHYLLSDEDQYLVAYSSFSPSFALRAILTSERNVHMYIIVLF